ncbi:MAG: hypothetical protein ABSC71_09225 [Candidatus Acidiferrales bacterium]
MTFFNRKDGDGVKTPKRRDGDLALVDGAGAVPSHRLTMDMARAESLASMMAHSRAATTVEVADLLAGMYIYEWDRLSKYWDDEEKVEPYLQQICRISPQRWHYWIEFHHRQIAVENEPKKWKLPIGGKKDKDEVAVPKLAHSAGGGADDRYCRWARDSGADAGVCAFRDCEPHQFRDWS